MLRKYGLIAKMLHWSLMALCFYAVGCCGFKILPAWGHAENYETINATLLSIALSYIAGYLIYLLTSVLPRKQREAEVFKLWEPHVSALYNEMSCRICEVASFVDIPYDKLKVLTEDDCEPLTRYTAMPSTIRIQKTITSDNYKEPLREEDEFSIKRDLNRHHDSMQHYLSLMLSNPMAIDSEKKIIDLLSRIKEASFLKECTRIIQAPIIQDGIQINITTADLPKAFIEYVRLRDELAKYASHKNCFEMRKLTEEEVHASKIAISEHLAKMGMTEQMEREISQKITNASKKQ